MISNKYTVVVIEPSEMLADGLCRVIDASPDFRVAGCYSDLNRYQEQPDSRQTADVVILNPALIAYGRKCAVRSLFPDSRPVALLYQYFDREILRQFHETIELYDKPAKVLHKLDAVMSQGGHESAVSDGGELSDREREILIAVAKGMMNKEIADACNISIHTVISHRKNISRKTGIKSVSGFVVYALLNGLIQEYEVQ